MAIVLINTLITFGAFFGAFTISVGFHEIGHFLVLRHQGVNGRFGFKNGSALVSTRLYGEDVYRLNTARRATEQAAGGFLELVWLIPILLIFPSVYTAVLFGAMLLYDCLETVNAPYAFHKKLSDVEFYLESKEDHEVFYRLLKEMDSEYVMLPLLKTCYEINPFLDVEVDVELRKMARND